jgi:hypothetical protein
MRIWNSLRLRADNNSGHAGIYATENHSSRHHLQSTSDPTKARNFNFLIHEQEQHYLFSWNAGFGSERLSLWKSDVRIESNQPPWEKTRPSDKRYSLPTWAEDWYVRTAFTKVFAFASTTVAVSSGL